MIIVTYTGQTRAGRAFGSVKGLRVRARKSLCTLKIKSERTNVWEIPTTRSDRKIDLFLSCCFLPKFWGSRVMISYLSTALPVTAVGIPILTMIGSD